MPSVFPPSDRVHLVMLLALPDVVPFDLVIGGQVFAGLPASAGPSPYTVQLCSLEPGLVTMSSGIPIGIPRGLDALQEADTIIVPGLGDTERPVPPAALLALRHAHARGARLVSICTGAFVLAEAGLLDGRRAATHWAHAARLAERFPAVQVDARVLYVEDGSVLTSAGMAAGIDLCLHIVRTDFGAELANAIAREMVVAPHREGGQAQFIAHATPAADSAGLAATRSWVLEHIAAPLTVAHMAGHANLSVRHFVRRFSAETGLSPLRWLLAQRVLHAQRLLEVTDLPIGRIAEASGLGSAASLRVHFRRVVGTAPHDYRRTFRSR